MLNQPNAWLSKLALLEFAPDDGNSGINVKGEAFSMLPSGSSDDEKRSSSPESEAFSAGQYLNQICFGCGRSSAGSELNLDSESLQYKTVVHLVTYDWSSKFMVSNAPPPLPGSTHPVAWCHRVLWHPTVRSQDCFTGVN